MSDTVLPLTQPQTLARIAGVDAATAASVLAVTPAVDRPIGLAVALSQTPSAFVRNAKLTKGAAARSFNALHFS